MSLTLTINPPFPLHQRTRRAEGFRLPRRRTVAPSTNRFLVNVDFVSPEGEGFFAVGGGETLIDAIASAREGLPLASEWGVARWNHIHGD